MPIRNGYYVLAQQFSGEIIRVPNTTKKFNELLFVFLSGGNTRSISIFFEASNVGTNAQRLQ
jgi:hypothetical protein